MTITNYKTTDGKNHIIKVVPRSKWKCEIMDDFWIIPREGGEPNRLHRKIQEIVFGVRWVYIDEETK